MTINNIECELNLETVSNAQVKFASNPDGSTHTSNVVTHQNLLSSRIIGIRHKEVSVLTPLKDLSIFLNNQPALSISTRILQAQQALNLPVVQEIAVDTALKTRGQTGLRGKLAGLLLMEIPQFSVKLV